MNKTMLATAPMTSSYVGPTGPAVLPFLGWRGNSLRFFRDPIAYMRSVYREHGEVGALAAGEPRHLFVFGPEPLRELLTDQSLFHTIIEHVTPERLKSRRRGVGLLNMNGDEHKAKRRLMMPSFHKKAVAGYRDDMVRLADQFADRLRVGDSVDVCHEMHQLALVIACKTLFGLDVTRQADRIGLLVHRVVSTPFFSPAITLFPYDVPGTPCHRMLTTVRALEDEILSMIRERRASKAGPTDMLGMLTLARDEDGGSMSDEELVGQMVTLLVAGHETTASALTWTLFLLALHPDVLGDVQDELEGALHGAPPTVEDLAKLPLLGHVVTESMRILPPVSVSSRVSTRPFTFGKYRLPAETFLTFSPLVTHRISSLYADAQRFLPRRWETLSRGTYEYIPFGAGPRLCIGATFAGMELRIILSILLQRFRFALPARTHVSRQCKFSLQPKGGLPMMVRERRAPLGKPILEGNIREMIDL
jgi:cytochrome P450